MHLTLNCHQPTFCEASKLGGDEETETGTLQFMGPERSGLHCVTVFMPLSVARAMAATFKAEMEAHEARMLEEDRAYESAQRAREMNAELPEDVREVMHLKGMI